MLSKGPALGCSSENEVTVKAMPTQLKAFFFLNFLMNVSMCD